MTAAGTAQASGSGTGSDWQAALDAALAGASAVPQPDLLFLFAHSAFADVYPNIVEAAQKRLAPRHLIGCSGQGLITTRREIETEPSIVALTVSLPGAALTPLRFPADAPPDATAVPADATCCLLFADPYTSDVEAVLQQIDQARPGLPVIGGIASSLNGQRGTAVFLDGELHGDGAVGLAVGGTGLRAVVSQGCLPIGRPWTITGVSGNLIETIGSRPAIDVLIETLEELDPETRQRAQMNLLVGLAMDEYRDEHGIGDFLIRNLLGVQRDTGALAISAYPRLGQTLQFQMRDARTADEHLRQTLQQARTALGAEQPVAALMCSCNGRGSGLFGPIDHDPTVMAETLGDIPVAGLFCSGEIGPVGRQNFLHGFTATIALFTCPEQHGG